MFVFLIYLWKKNHMPEFMDFLQPAEEILANLQSPNIRKMDSMTQRKENMRPTQENVPRAIPV